MAQLNWNDLQYFLAIARAGNPSRAAKRMGIDHTTVRRRMAVLEEALNAKLLDRRDQRYTLTAEGKKLMESAEAVESLMLGMENSVSGNDASVAGSVRVGAADGLGNHFLAPRLVEFQRAQPELQIELVVMSRQFNLSKREADIALVMNRPKLGHQATRKLIDSRLSLYASEDYLRAAPPIATVSDLQGHRFIGYIDGATVTPEWDKMLPAMSDVTHPRFASNNIVTQLRAAIAGGGICFLPPYMVQEAPTLRPILHDEIQISREIWLIIHSDLRHIARFRAVADFIVSEVTRCKELFA